MNAEVVRLPRAKRQDIIDAKADGYAEGLAACEGEMAQLRELAREANDRASSTAAQLHNSETENEWHRNHYLHVTVMSGVGLMVTTVLLVWAVIATWGWPGGWPLFSGGK
jgi:hypothetical protein